MKAATPHLRICDDERSATRRALDGASPDLSASAAFFTDIRQLLFGVAYRMMGSANEAEDIVQDVWLRWQGCDRAAVRDPIAFLVTTTTRMCINELRSARVRRELYVGPWLPEPVDTDADPAVGVERGEALEFATLILLESLHPTERAAYILREAFDYPYSAIARIIQVSDANARKLVSRARKHLGSGRTVPANPTAHRRLLTAFVAAARSGEMSRLERLFAADAHGDPDDEVCVAARCRADRTTVA